MRLPHQSDFATSGVTPQKQRVSFIFGLVLLSLFLGTAATTGAGWTAARFGSAFNVRDLSLDETQQLWHRYSRDTWEPHALTTTALAEGGGTTLRSARTFRSSVGAFGMVVEVESGWPCRSFRTAMYFDQDDVRPSVAGGWLASYSIEDLWRGSTMTYYVVPYRPIVAGFALNSAFYAIIFLILGVAAWQLRHMLRSARGRCVGCGYDLLHLRSTAIDAQVSGTCPECGLSQTAMLRQ